MFVPVSGWFMVLTRSWVQGKPGIWGLSFVENCAQSSALAAGNNFDQQRQVYEPSSYCCIACPWFGFATDFFGFFVF
jgi:hypothetical protein